MVIRCFVALAFAASAFLASSANAQSTPPRVATADPMAAPTAPAPASAPAPTDPLAIAVQQRLASPPGKAADGESEDLAALKSFYAERSYAPLWVSAGATSPKAALAIAEIKKADDWGLAASDFAVPEPIAGTRAPPCSRTRRSSSPPRS